MRKRLRAWRVTPKKLDEAVRFLKSDLADREGQTLLDRLATTGGLPTGEHLDKILRAAAVKKQALEVQMGENDEPVTADIKRLIRLPGSVHGKTALRVTTIPIDDLDAFDPLTEAVAFSDRPVTVDVSKPETVRFGDKQWDIEPGRQELPEQVALFVCLRRKGLVA